MTRLARPAFTSRRRGRIVVLSAASMVTLLACAIPAVDVGDICALTGEPQSNADAGSLAGASMDYGGTHGLWHQPALHVIADNRKPQGSVSFEDQSTEVGGWHGATGTFTALDFMSSSCGGRSAISRQPGSGREKRTAG